MRRREKVPGSWMTGSAARLRDGVESEGIGLVRCTRVDGDPREPDVGLTTPQGDAPAHHEMLAFERVAARLIGRRQKRIAIGRYRMREELGRGGFGAVYTAYDPELDRDVAVKLVLPRKGRKDAKWEARLVREAQTLAQVEHPNVVSVYDVGVDAATGGVYVVMELLQGLSARKWKMGPPEPALEHVIEAYIGAARGLGAAHAMEIVHRDFKPDNLMITHDGVAKVIDFGLARDVNDLDSTRISGSVSSTGSGGSSSGTPLTSMGTVMGTPPYMAPEQHALGSIGPATDQYALCVALFEALYGVRPFVADDIDALYTAKRTMKLSALPKRHGVPRALQEVVLRGLSPDPAKRWGSMDALAMALGNATTPRRRAIGVLSVGAAVVLASVLGAQQVSDVEPCAELTGRAPSVWSPARAEALQTHLLAEVQGPEATVWAAAQGRLDERLFAWRGAVDQACAAKEASRIECLDRWLRDAEIVIEVLEQEDVDPGATMSVVDTLPRLEACGAGEAATGEDVPLRDGFVRARALARAGSGEEALELADALVEEASETEDPALIAQASLAAGLVYAERERLDDARMVLIEANEQANVVGLDAVAAEAAIVLVRVSGAMGRFDDAHRWAALAEARMARLGNPPYLEALLLGSRAFELIYEGDFVLAYALSRELVELLSGDDVKFERARAMANVAMAAFEIGRMHEARAVIAEARGLMASILGERHAAVARMLSDEGRYAAAAGDVEDGIAQMQRAVELLEAAGGPNDPYALNTKRTLAHYLARVGRFDDSLKMLEQTYASTAELYGTVHVRTATTAFALADQYLMAERPEDAERLVREAMATLTELYGARSPRLAVGSELLGRALAQQGKRVPARDVVTRALAALTDATPGERESTVNLTMVLAGLDQDEGRLDDAARNLARAISLAQSDASLADPSMLASLEGGLAFVEAERGRHELAVKAARKALEHLDRIGAGEGEKIDFQALIEAGGVLPEE